MTPSLLRTEDWLDAVERHSLGFAAAARRDLAARVRSCPEWDVADLVWHLTEVHWFWATIVEELLQEPPDAARRPRRPEHHTELLLMFESGARRLLDVLRAADPQAPCWTWAPQRQDVAFVARHQVQEAAVHHWDVADAVGEAAEIGAEVAADSVEEFLTYSVSSQADPADPPRPSLNGAVWICACVSESAEAWTWLVTDGVAPGTVAWRRVPDGEEPAGLVPPGTALVGGHAAPVDVLLWLYGRVAQPFEGGPTGDTAVLDRLLALTFTD